MAHAGAVWQGQHVPTKQPLHFDRVQEDRFTNPVDIDMDICIDDSSAD